MISSEIPFPAMSHKLNLTGPRSVSNIKEWITAPSVSGRKGNPMDEPDEEQRSQLRSSDIPENGSLDVSLMSAVSPVLDRMRDELRQPNAYVNA